MKRCYVLSVLLLLFALPASAQDATLQLVLQHINDHPQIYQLTPADLSDIVVTHEYTDDRTGVTHLYLVQRHSGIDVFDGVINAHVRNGEVLHVGNRFVSKLAGRISATSPGISAVAATEAAAQDLDLPLSEPLTVVESTANTDQKVILSTGGISLEPIPVRLVYQPIDDGSARLAWQVRIFQIDEQHYWDVRVDALTGVVLERDDLVVEDDFGFETAVTDAPDWREDPAQRARLIERYRAEKALAAERAAATSGSAAGDGVYDVYALPHESPTHAGEPEPFGTAVRRTRVSEATAADPTASPLGWHDDGSLVYPTTRGNNVWAYADHTNAEVGYSPTDGTSRDFTTDNPNPAVNYNINFSDPPLRYHDGAIVNLFYLNNMMHDVFYKYGFTEKAGNMQQTNLGRGGEEGDFVLAQAQDGGGVNNANMLTLEDGISPRMQMFLWLGTSGLDDLLFVDSPDHLAGTYKAREAVTGRPLDQVGVTGNLLMAHAIDGIPEEGCAPYENATDMVGKIALVRRGTCTFSQKGAFAEAAGAIGVIVYNNVPGDPISMSMAGVVIPAIMISQSSGQAFEAELDAGGTVHGTMRREEGQLKVRDGDFDNGIIAHEYMHSVSIRSVGGPMQTCLGGNEQGGEGWSDWAALMLTMQASHSRNTPRGIGTYAIFEDPTTGGGIRPAPYSTDMGVNPYTYGNINGPGISVPHGVGFLWATAMWEVVWNLVDHYGFDPDLYAGNGGNNLAMRLITEGLKYTACNPSFIDMRDGLLAADRALFPIDDPSDPRESENECRIWEGMARRGLGVNAKPGGEEDFTLPVSCAPRLTIEKTVDKPTTVAGDVVTFTTTVTNETVTPASNVVVTDTIPANSQLIDGSISNGTSCQGSVSNGVVTFNVGDLAARGGTQACSYQVRIDGSVHTASLFLDDMESGDGNWTTDATPPTWTYQPVTTAHSGTAAWFANDFATDANQHLTLAQPFRLPAAGETPSSTGTPELSFWHHYNTEENFDGGFVEISTDNGATWQGLGSRMVENGYRGTFFHGDSEGYIRTRVDLTDFAGKDVKVRFRMFSDLLVPGVGWFVDDVAFVDRGCVSSTAYASSTEFPDAVTATAYSCVTNTEPIAVDVAARVMLEGAFDGATGQMHTQLNAAGHLPASQPFADASFDGTPMDYDGAERVADGFFAANPDVVDWVLVELRTGPDPAERVARRPALLKRDGSVVALDGSSPVTMTVPEVKAHYVVVRHRNHLPVMSAQAVALDGSTLAHDFTMAQGQAAGSESMKDLGGAFGLYSGDANGDGSIDINDINQVWRSQVGTSGYRSADFNLDGQVQTSDKNHYWKPNRNRSTSIDQPSL